MVIAKSDANFMMTSWQVLTIHITVLLCGNKRLVMQAFNTLRLRQNGRDFANDIFKRIFLKEKARFFTKISLKFVLKGPIDNNPALVKIMTWRRLGDKPLSEPTLTRFTDAYLCSPDESWNKQPSGQWN